MFFEYFPLNHAIIYIYFAYYIYIIYILYYIIFILYDITIYDIIYVEN